MRNAYSILTRKPEGKRPLGRTRHTWEDIIRMDVSEIGLEGGDWIHVAQGRMLGPFEHGNEPSDSMKGKGFLH
jgi:hypothetical protein